MNICRKEEKTYIAEGKIGLGVFAKIAIGKNEKIGTLLGPEMSLERAIDEEDNGSNCIQIGDQLYFNSEGIARRLNHSCDPNAGIKNNRELVALQNIKKDEEISFDYSTTMDEDAWTMKCRCGSKNCRGVIKDFKYLPSDLQRKYLLLGIVQNFIAKKYVFVKVKLPQAQSPILFRGCER